MDHGIPDYGETARIGDAKPRWIGGKDESGEAVCYNAENGIITFLAWFTMVYEGHNIHGVYRLGDLLRGLGITLEECRKALGEGNAQ